MGPVPKILPRLGLFLTFISNATSVEDYDPSHWPINVSALCELFEKADATGDGTISIEEYILMCDTYGIELTEEHIDEFRKIADSDGEVERRLQTSPDFAEIDDFVSH